jgi:1-acyl-sn-glycerol-3-phosphate acyltransferase
MKSTTAANAAATNDVAHLKTNKTQFTPYKLVLILRNLLLILFVILSLTVANLFLIVVWLLSKLNLLSERSKNRYNSVGGKIIFYSFIISAETVGGLEIEFSGDQIPSNESAIIMANHVSDFDWIPVFALGASKGMIGEVKFIVKESLK